MFLMTGPSPATEAPVRAASAPRSGRSAGYSRHYRPHCVFNTFTYSNRRFVRPSLPKSPNTYTLWVEPWGRESRIQTCTLCSRVAFLTARFATEAFFFFATAAALYATATLRVG